LRKVEEMLKTGKGKEKIGHELSSGFADTAFQGMEVDGLFQADRGKYDQWGSRGAKVYVASLLDVPCSF
jgi:hypothetical protein